MAQGTDQSPHPPPELAEVLTPLFGPCPAFAGACRGVTRWNPSAGHVPRAFRGAIGMAEDVRLVLVCAEPGDPFPEESYAANATPGDYFRSVYLTRLGLSETSQDRGSVRSQHTTNTGHGLAQ
jgi:hypothetical protein